MNILKNLDKYTKIAIIVILIATILRFSLASIYHVSGDACWQLSNSKFIADNLKFPLFEMFGRDEPFWPPPLFHIISAFIYKIFSNLGEDVANFAIKMISPLMGSLTLIFSFLIAKDLFNKKIALYSLIFLAFIPLHIDYSVFSYVDGTVTFLAVLSVYLALKNRIMGSSIVAGLAILTKYNGAFIVPVLLFIVYMKNKNDMKNLMRNAAIITIIPMAIGAIWFTRNWIYLGNPAWPFMNNVFNGYEVMSFAQSGTGSISLANVQDLSGIISIYLGIFGVPNGNINTLSFFSIPYLNLLFAIWILATIIFIIPFLIGLPSKKLNHKNLLLVWIVSYLVLVLLYIVNAGFSISRFLLPAFPAVALIWAHGLQKITVPRIKQIFYVLLTLIIMGFILTSYVKIGFAAKTWSFYDDDFEWVKSNTNKNSIFLTGSQCISYNIERQTLSPYTNNLEKADYVWVNQDFSLDRMAHLNKDIISELDKGGMGPVYENKKTNTRIYRIR